MFNVFMNSPGEEMSIKCAHRLCSDQRPCKVPGRGSSPNPHDPIRCSRCRRVNCTQGTIPKAQPSETEPSGCVRGGRLGSISRGKIGEPLAQVQTAVTPI
ncbi:hypothetical protein CDAR_306701 [Caerostris darwini]|uniref:Nuclear receptor domain-containing protein n=1 Tax=Caerostris darwini TaxID=1538125 RepID=A0AAV4SEN8_9ARAC|nr:hypothetical protein CDAR_306701 [Caerostris darwini]